MTESSKDVVTPTIEAKAVGSSVAQESATRTAREDELADDEFDSDEYIDDEIDDDDDGNVEAAEPRISTLLTSASEDELATMAADMLSEMVHLMGFKAEVTATWQEEDADEDDDGDDSADEDQDTDEKGEERRKRYLHLDVEGTDLGPLIGRRGETLDNMQYLLRLMINQKIHQWKNIVIDVERYKERRLNQLRQLAERMAEQVARTGRAISLEPMPANERRIVHMVLRDHPDVYTESYGEGPRRKVHIFARD
jgi:spoIIIJ-associated protein